MGYFYVCERHGHQPLVPVSPRFRQAIADGRPALRSQLVTLVILHEKSATGQAMDVEVLRSLGIAHAGARVTLRDRDKARRQLHDRLAIRRIFSGPEPGMCKACLHEWADAARDDGPPA